MNFEEEQERRRRRGRTEPPTAKKDQKLVDKESGGPTLEVAVVVEVVR
jgi:hypothetical protein